MINTFNGCIPTQIKQKYMIEYAFNTCKVIDEALW